MVEEGLPPRRSVTSRCRRESRFVKPATGALTTYFPPWTSCIWWFSAAAPPCTLDRQQKALASDRPLHAFWGTLTEPKDTTTLLLEFMGLANHRKEIRGPRSRPGPSAGAKQQIITALNFIVRGARHRHPKTFPSRHAALRGLSSAAIGRRTLDTRAGTRHLRRGHDEAVALVNRFLDRFESAATESLHTCRSAPSS